MQTSSQGWSWPSAGMLICSRCLPGQGHSLPHVARLVDEYLVGWLDERVLWEACEFGASRRDLDFVLSRTTPDWSEVVNAAARGGHLHAFQWMGELQDDRGPWQADFYNAMAEAACHGHLETIKWLHERGLRCISGRVFTNAASHDHLAVLRWLHEHPNYHITSGATTGMRFAAQNGHLATVRWLYDNFTAADINTAPAMAGAAGNGDLDMLQWLHQQKRCSEACSTQVMDAAVGGGHFRVVEWLYENCRSGCSNVAASEAAKTGNLLMLQWLHEHYDDRFDSGVMDMAALEGHLEVTKWLHEHRSEGCTSRAMNEAAKNGHLEIVRWLHDNRTEGCTTAAMDGAAKCGHLDIVKWLYESRTEGCTDKATNEAVRNGHADVVQWLVEHFPGKCRDDLMVTAAWNGHLDVARYLDENTKQRASRWGLGAATRQGWLKTLLVLVRNSKHRDGGIDWFRSCLVGDAFDKILAQLPCHRNSPACSRWSEALESLELFHSLGCYSYVSLMLERALKKGYLPLVEQYVGRRDMDEKRKYAAAAAHHGDIVLLRWMLVNGTPIDKSSVIHLATERIFSKYIEVAAYLPEDERILLVCEAVAKKKYRKLLRWTLLNSRIDDDNARATICNAIKQAPNGTARWLCESLTSAEARKWCL